MKISEAFEKYRKNEVKALGKSKNTDASYVYTERIVVKYFGNINIKRITLDGVHDFYIWMTQSHQQNTSRDYVCRLRTVLYYCRRNGYHVIDPDSIVIPKKEKKVPRFLVEDEFDKFLQEVSRQHRGYSHINRVRNIAITKLLYTTGLRIGELCALNRDSIKDRQFTVVGKSKNPRPCFITKEIEDDINKYLTMRNDSEEALFISEQTGKRITKGTVQRLYRGVSSRAGISRVTPHALRHSFATLMIENGVDVRFVAELLGHQSLETTKKYTHVRDSRLKQVYDSAMESVDV